VLKVFIADEIKAIMERDPAATNVFEALLYPSLHAILLHRVAHKLYGWQVPFLPRLVSQIARSITGIEIHPGAKIGKGLFIDHGMGVVIGETTVIGDNVTLYQGVTLGGTGKQRGKRHPTLGNNVLVGVGAKVLGAITLGDNVRVGANAVVLKDVPPNTTAVGVPAKVVAMRLSAQAENQRIENLPDPSGDMLNALQDRAGELEERLRGILEQHIQETHEIEHDHQTISQLEAQIAFLEKRLQSLEQLLLAREGVGANLAVVANGSNHTHS
jgi:serine O-acetyltransferase